MKFNIQRRDVKILIVALLTLCLAGCMVNSVVTDIQNVVNIISDAAPIIAAFSGPGAVLVAGYFVAATDAGNCVLMVAEMPGSTTGSVAAAIPNCLVQAALPVLPANTPTNIVNIIKAINSALTNLLNQYAAVLKMKPAATPMNLTWYDHHVVHSMSHKLMKAKAKVLATHPK